MKRALGITSFLLILIFAAQINAQEVKEIEKTFSMNKTGIVEVDTYKGEINVETWDKAEVYVHVRIEADGFGRNDKKRVENTEIIFRDSDSRVSMATEYPKNSFWGNSGSNPFVCYTIKMPKTAELEINDYKSDTKIVGLNSEVKLETYKGTVTIDDFIGAIDLETYKGDVEITFNQIKDDCSFETFKGRIELRIPSDSKFSLDADLGHKGDYDSDFDISSNSNRRRDHNDEYVRGDVNGGGPYIEFSTYKGDLRLMKK